MGLDSTALITELKSFVAGLRGAQDISVRMLAARTLELAELVQEQTDEIEELRRRVDRLHG
jgi:nitrogen-specific signal transduction histidine kinase